MRKLSSLLLAILATITFANAEIIERVNIGDLYYNLDDFSKTAEVTSPNSGYPYWSTTITTANIPSTVTYNEIVYDVTSIGQYAFAYCDDLSSVYIPHSIIRIGYEAFGGCTGLTAIDIPNSVTSIGEFAFWSCSGLTSVDIPNSVTSIGKNAFSKCSGLTSVTIPNSVTSIGNEAFYYCTSLTSVIIPNSVTSMGNYVFHHCISLTSVTISNGCTDMGQYLFLDCTALTSVTIPNSVTSIGLGAFNGCTALTSVIIPNSVKVIQPHAFRSCQSLTSIEIPKSVKVIGQYAFSNCTSLTSIEIPNNVKIIQDKAFSNCSGLTSFIIPDSITSFGDGVISYCTGLTSVTIPDYFTSIGKEAFAGCTGLTSIEIHKNITSIGDQAFAGCTGFTTIEIPNSVTSIGGYAFDYCTGLTSVEIPNSIKSINYRVFAHCTGLTSVTIPNSVTSIGMQSFMSCTGLISVIIPNSVTSIGYGAFDGCTGLTSITCDAVNPPTVETFGFYDVDRSIPVYVPSKSLDAYKTAKVWKTFTNIVPVKCLIGSGTCGENLTWELDCDSILTISGTGAMTDFADPTASPWYANKSFVKTIIMDDNITGIGDNAFYGCSELDSIEIHNNISRIGQYAFAGCTGLKSITCNAVSLPTLGENVFFDVPKSIPLYVPAKSIDLYRSADQWKDFMNMEPILCLLASGTCGANLTWELSCDGVLTISGTGAMTDFDNGTAMPWYANISSIKAVVIDNNVTSIGMYAFYECIYMKSIEIPNSVTSIMDYAFDGCCDLRSLPIPKNISYIGEGIGYGCMRLKSITVDPENPNYSDIDGVLFNKTQTELLQYPLGKTAQSYTIPSSVTHIGGYAFSWYTNWTSFTCAAVTPPTCGTDAFQEVSRTIPLYVPAASVNAYKGADTWKEFTTIYSISDLPTSVENVISETLGVNKFLHNGQIFILRGDKTYTLTGQQVR